MSCIQKVWLLLLLLLCIIVGSFKAQENPFYDTHHIGHFKSGPLKVDSRVLPSPQYSVPISSKHYKSAVQQPNTNVDVEAIMAPLMQPLMHLFDYYSHNKQTLEHAQKTEKKKKSSMFDSESLLQALDFQPPDQQKQPSIMDKLFEPVFQPIKKEFEKAKNSHLPVNDALVPPTMFNSDSIRRATGLPQTSLVDSKGPLSSLLESLGMNARPHEEVQVGRDKSISILGMPVGRRDGIALSPLTGVSYGNQDMFGPIAVNDKYNVKWDFLDKIGLIFAPIR